MAIGNNAMAYIYRILQDGDHQMLFVWAKAGMFYCGDADAHCSTIYSSLLIASFHRFYPGTRRHARMELWSKSPIVPGAPRRDVEHKIHPVKQLEAVSNVGKVFALIAGRIGRR